MECQTRDCSSLDRVGTPNRAGSRVLIVDGSCCLRERLTAALETLRGGVMGEFVPGEDEALARLERIEYEAVLYSRDPSDSRAEGFLARARDLRPALKLFVLLSRDDPEFAARARATGAIVVLLGSTGLRKSMAFLRRVLELIRLFGPTGPKGPPRRRAAELLPEDRLFMKALLEAPGSLIVVLDPVGRIVLFNKACEAISGYAFEAVRGKTMWSVLLPSDQVGIAKSVWEDLLSGAPRSRCELDWVAKDGRRRSLAWSTIVRRNAAGTVQDVTCAGIDVTEQLKGMRDEIARGRNLAAIGEAAAVIAHEVKNPLAAISASVQVFRDDFPREDPRYGILNEVVNQVARLDGMVRRLLLLSKPWIPRKEMIDLNATVRKVVELVSRDELFARVRFCLEGARPVRAWADANLFEQILWNLFLNTAEAAMGDVEIRLGVAETAKDVRVTVADTGPGIPREVQARLFQPFFTTKASGNGLGLATCRKIMDAHQGGMTLESVPGSGTSVTLHFAK